MPAIVEVKFYNSFLLRKTVTNTSGNTPNKVVWNGSTGVAPGTAGAFPIYTTATSDVVQADKSWVIEESRIEGGYNETEMLYGVKAYLVDDEPNASFRTSALIYSGVFNSRTGVNDTNVFSVGEDITKALDPALGSIQKLHAEDTNLIIFQENKVNRALIDKDAIYSAEGDATAVSQLRLVIGQIVPYAGNFGISKDPKSFAVYGYRKYFADKDRNAILRLSQDGITEISNYGMIDYFRDELNNISSDVNTKGEIIGGWDIYTKQYVLSLQGTNVTPTQEGGDGDDANDDTYQTLSFDEQVLGWTGRYTYKPEQIFSIKSKFYTVKSGTIWEHNAEQPGEYNRSKFYGIYSPSKITFIFNPNISASKVFKTINYEGSTGWEVSSFKGARSFEVNDIALPVTSYDEGQYIIDPRQLVNDATNPNYNKAILQASYEDVFGVENPPYPRVYSGFYKKEGKYVANLINDSSPTTAEVVFGGSMSGVKGYYSTVTIETDDLTQVVGQGGVARELFAASSEYVESSY
jgi:hypothetical protein|tara:strand:- start:473 stop:2035 length:1563 start_codon:yes stop_codon:yes gene_type:complete